jgi:hypothetical protein
MRKLATAQIGSTALPNAHYTMFAKSILYLFIYYHIFAISLGDIPNELEM